MEIKLPDYKTDTGFTLFQKNKNKANLEALAEEFESMFVNQMMKQARESRPMAYSLVMIILEQC